MSKIGKKIIEVPEGIAIVIGNRSVTVKGSRGESVLVVPQGVRPVLEGRKLRFELLEEGKQGRSNWGTLRALLANAIAGLGKDFEKTLVLEGVGFRVAKEGNDLALNLGFSHPVKYRAPEGVAFEVEKNTILKVRGADRARVGQVAAEIRALKKPDPYKGKGFHYADEVIRRKAGKKAATAGAAPAAK